MSYKTYAVKDSGSETANGNSGSKAIPSGGQGVDCTFHLDVTIASVSDTLDVTIVATIAGVTITLATFTQATGITNEDKVVTNCPETIQADWVIAGTAPDFTFSISARRH